MLLDVNMPGMDGYQVARLVSGCPRTKYLPIVMVTANNHDHDQSQLLEAYQAGAVDYIIKPFQNEILLNKVKQFIALFNANENASKSLLEAASLQKEKDIILNAAGEGIVKLDQQGFIVYANDKALQILQVDSAVLVHTNFDQLFMGDDERGVFENVSDKLQSVKDVQRYRLDVVANDGELIPIEAICTIAQQLNGEYSVIVLFQDIIDRVKMEARLIHLANYDSLTGLSNRAYFQDSLMRATSRSKRQGSLMSLLSIDLDRFKNVNDTYGHDMGDALLMEVANRLRETLRDIDVISRLGGDEFAVIIEDIVGGEESGRHIADKLVQELAAPYVLKTANGTTLSLAIECSIGVAFNVAGALTVDALVKAADLALYEAKHMGRNTFRVFLNEMSETSKRHADIENALRLAIFNNSFMLVYQPQVSLSQKRVIGFESLLRMSQPELGVDVYSPAEFIPVAEESGLIHSVGDMVLHMACKQLEYWSYYFEKNNMTLSVNLSAKQISATNFIEHLDQILSLYSIDPKRLVFEITETAILEHGEESITSLRALKQRGYLLSLDDFGTGYSSLSHLQQLPVDHIKIDRCFIQELDNNPKNYALVKAILSIADTFSLQVVAEGVESQNELSSLMGLACESVQGYFYSKPVEASEVEQTVDKIQAQCIRIEVKGDSNITQIKAKQKRSNQKKI